MSTTIHATHAGTPFGLVQGFITGVLFLAGGLLAMMLYLSRIGQVSPVELAGHLLPVQQMLAVTLGIWALEIGLYFTITWVLAHHHFLVAVVGVFVGLILRQGVALLISALLSQHSSESAVVIFGKMANDYWLLNVLAIITSALILLIPFHGLLAAGFLFHGAADENLDSAPKRFSFATTPAPSATSGASGPSISRTPTGKASQLAPPDGFTPLPPRDDVSGMVNIPTDIIAASVPEAAAYLREGTPVRVRLAHLVPQLSQATVWLTWQQVFLSTPEDPNAMHGPNRPDASLQGRWIKVPAHAYVPQVPREHFLSAGAPPPPPKWMTLPPVPQEEQFGG